MADEAKKWKVRADDGSVFGPVDKQTLVAWAKDGRLAPSHMMSCDDAKWVPVASCPELAMDWVVELQPGRFHGPINHDAMAELLRDGSVAPSMALFSRVASIDDAPSSIKSENDSLRGQIEALRSDFSARAAELEGRISELETKNSELTGTLSTRDVEFDAERQSLKANELKLQAELAKAQSQIEVLKKAAESAARRDNAHAADVARIAELEKRLADAVADGEKKARDAATQEADLRRAIRDSESTLEDERRATASMRAKFNGLVEKSKTQRQRDESLRKLLRQAIDSIGMAPMDGDEVVIEATDDMISIGQPPSSPKAEAPSMLGAIEAQARKEISSINEMKKAASEAPRKFSLNFRKK